MSDVPPIPEAAVPTSPVQSPARLDGGSPDTAGEAKPAADEQAPRISRAQMVGAGVAVGSAAIAAALLFWGRPGQKK